MPNKTVDILLATYNGENYVREQLDSILNQTFQDFHLFIRDDHSTDTTPSILKEYAEKFSDKISLLNSSKQLGIRGNFSALMEKSTAPYIMLSDQDDVWNNNKVETTLAKMKESERLCSKESPLLIHTDLSVVDERLNEIAPSFWEFAGMCPQNYRNLNHILTQNVVTGCTVMINQPLLKYALPIPNNTVMHDWWLALVAASLGHIVPLPQSTIKYRQHSKNALGAKKFWSIESIWKALSTDSQQDKRKCCQAEELLHRYQHLLSEHETEIINAYLSSESAPYLKRGFLIAKYKLFKNGLMRNLANILLPK